MKRLVLFGLTLLFGLAPAGVLARDGELIEQFGGASIGAYRLFLNFGFSENHPSYTFQVEAFGNENDAIALYESWAALARPNPSSGASAEDAVEVPDVADDAIGIRRSYSNGAHFSVNFYFRIGTDVYSFDTTNNEEDPYDALYELTARFFAGAGSEPTEGTPDLLVDILAKLPNLGDLPEGYERVTERVVFNRV